MFTYWDIVKEMDRQRWDNPVDWTQEQYDMFYAVREIFETNAMVMEDYNGRD